jgi:hypothetical protein
MVCLHLTTSKPSTKSSQCRLISSTAFSSTAFDVFYARLHCFLGGSACSRRITTPLASRATFLHIVALHAVQLLLRFQLPNPCSLGLAASLPRSHTRVHAIWAYSCPGRTIRARANRASSALRARSAQHLHTPPASAVLPRACSRHPLGVARIRSCTAREPLQSCACPLTRAAWSRRRSVPPARVPVAAVVSALAPLARARRAHTHRTARVLFAARAPPVLSRANSLRPRSPAQFTLFAWAAPALPR